MKMNKKNLTLFSGFLLTACVTHSTTNSLMLKMPQPEAEAIWKYISQENPFTEWRYWGDHQGTHASNASFAPKHKLYTNKQAFDSKSTPLQNESMVITYLMDPSDKPEAIAVMYKVKGYNPAAGDWFWAKYSLTGEVQDSGKIQRCIACHTKRAADNDYIITHKFGTSTTSSLKEKPSLDPAAMLAAHNQWRSKTGVPALKWSNDLAGSSQKWADQLARNGCRSKHSTGKYGENIYWAGAAQRSDGTSSVQKIIDRDAVDAWGNEVQDYDYASNSCHGVCGHYTQVVWKSTTEVGCGMAICSDKAQLWVCQYTPRGNMVGEKPY